MQHDPDCATSLTIGRTRRLLEGLLFCALVGLVCGCTSEQRYATGQAYQRNQCERLPDAADRERCLANTSTTYEQYKRETGAGK